MAHKKWQTWSSKNVSVEQMKETFEEYKKVTKKDFIRVHDFKWKDAIPVYIEREKPLTFEWFINFAEDKLWCTVEQYFYPANYPDIDYSDYLSVCTRIKREIRTDQINWGMAWIYNPSITQRLNGLVEKKEVENKWESESAKAKAIEKISEKIDKIEWDELNTLIQDYLNT